MGNTPVHDTPSVYILMGEDGSVVYVGSSRCVGRRFLDHSRKSWWPEVCSIRIVRYETIDEMINEEIRYIHELRPRENKQHSVRSHYCKLHDVAEYYCVDTTVGGDICWRTENHKHTIEDDMAMLDNYVEGATTS